MKMLKEAAKIAATNDLDKNFIFGCIARRKDGTLVYSTNILVQKPTPEGHAEARILRKAGHGAVLWIARILRDGSWAMAKPCPDCQTLIKNRRVSRVYYTIGPDEYGVWDP